MKPHGKHKSIVEKTPSSKVSLRRTKGKAGNMNQIFRITVGPETIHGRLPPCRVGRTYSSIFHVAGLDPDVDPPKIWVNVVTSGQDEDEVRTLFWVGEWSSSLGLWVVKVNNEPSQTARTVPYALTVGGGADGQEYIIGQGTYVVYDNIAAGGGAGGGNAGESLLDMVVALEDRVDVIEGVLENMKNIPLFDPLGAFDMDMRNQVQAITNILRGV